MEALSMIEQLIAERNLLEDELRHGDKAKRAFIKCRIRCLMLRVAWLMRLVEWKTV